ncbi:MAG TPA: zinc ABC transporter substrate-binding protein [Deinococcales bacterium]|nr:zinc ABC transporter substrate-binding protein [Deinococcales bacterium]
MKRPLLTATLLALTGAGAQAQGFNVAVSTSIIEDLVRNVSGKRVTITTLAPRDADTHDFQPSTADSRSLAKARVVFLNGLGLEEWMSGTVRNAIPSGTPVVELASGIKPIKSDGEPDPHAWWDPHNAVQYVKAVADTLVKVDAGGAATYRTNAAAYTKALNDLDAWAAKQFATIPTARRKLVTNHDTFAYLARRYGLKVIGTVLPRGDSGREPSARELAALSDTIKREGVKAIFVENTIAPRIAQTIASSTGARLAPPLYTDSLGKPGTAGDTYAKAFRHNVNTIVAALR